MSSSLMTNTSAMTALQTLQMTNQQLDQVQNEISTGYKVSSASDNAAYWSIATTMRSDNNSLSTVNDALGLGSATVNTAYTAMDQVKDTLDKIKSDLVTATQPGVDKSKIQSDITEQLNQLKTYSDSASFSGNNWLSVNSSLSDYNSTQSVVASFTRSSSGSPSLGTIDVDLSGITLFDANSAKSGILQAGQALTNTGGLTATPTVVAGTDGTPDTAATLTFGAFGSSAMTLDDNDAIKFDLAVNGGNAQTITINKATVDAALGTSDGKISDADDMATVMTTALANAGITSSDVTVSNSSGSIKLTTATLGSSASLAATNAASSDNGNFTNVMDIDITNASSDQLNSYLDDVDTMFQNVTTAASNLGSVQSRITSQQTFVSDLMNSIDSGVGSLVDADMNEASTRLKALQTQQQLGIQALSIANSNSSNILSLFR